MTSPMRKLGLVLAGAGEAIDTPLPGVYPGIPPRVYHLWPGASNSRLTKIRQSPAHLKAYMDDPPQDVAHFATGRAVHSAILEPEDFASRYVVASQCTATKKGDGLRCGNAGVIYAGGEWFCGVHGKGIGSSSSSIVLSPTDYDLCVKARDTVFAHPQARKLLTGQGEAELSLIWNDADTSTLCKARVDRYSPAIAGGVIVDVKTCRDASAVAFEKSVYEYGYHRQSAHYLTGAAAVGLEARHFVNICVEKERPYAVAVYRMTEGAIDAGAQQLKPLIARYAECLAKDEWPGYSSEIQDIALPTYAWSQIDNEIKESA